MPVRRNPFTLTAKGSRSVAFTMALVALAAAALAVAPPAALQSVSAQSTAGQSPQPAALAGDAAKANHPCDALGSENGKLEVTMKVPIDGSYFVWLRAKAPNAESSLTVSVDSIDKTRSCGIRIADKRRMRPFWGWLNTRENGRYSVPLKAGTTRIQITGDPSHSDVSLDRVLLVINPDCTPTMATSSCGGGPENNTPVTGQTTPAPVSAATGNQPAPNGAASGQTTPAATPATQPPPPAADPPTTPPPAAVASDGDVDGDGESDDQDLAIINRNYNKPSASRDEGDLNGDGVVNVLDLAVFTRSRFQ